MNTRAVPVENLDRLHILLVDNNPVSLEKKAFLLERFGCLVTCSTNGIEANILLETYSETFDVVIADNSVTGMSKIKSERSPADAPVVLYIDKDILEDVFIDDIFLTNMSSWELN